MLLLKASAAFHSENIANEALAAVSKGSFVMQATVPNLLETQITFNARPDVFHFLLGAYGN